MWKVSVVGSRWRSLPSGFNSLVGAIFPVPDAFDRNGSVSIVRVPTVSAGFSSPDNRATKYFLSVSSPIKFESKFNFAFVTILFSQVCNSGGVRLVEYPSQSETSQLLNLFTVIQRRLK